jgi:hypothetical protein
MQRTDPDVVSVVYSGDIDASKENIISKVKVRIRFMIYECNPIDSMAVLLVCIRLDLTLLWIRNFFTLYSFALVG